MARLPIILLVAMLPHRWISFPSVDFNPDPASPSAGELRTETGQRAHRKHRAVLYVEAPDE